MTPRDETVEHIRQVGLRLKAIADDLLRRAEQHDASKLQSPEWEMFEQATSKLRGLEYGSPEYMEGLKRMGPALVHHYRHNDHHPQHFDDGVRGMSLIQLTELLSDWHAAVMRHETGDIMESIKINQGRFGYGDELKRIFENTVRHMEAVMAK